jgi:triacylglycerol esterase/lipase EstA (alpha/beta hydrolase family)
LAPRWNLAESGSIVGRISHVYLSPGMFGFARLASFDYFEHVVRAIEERFRARGRSAKVHVCEVHPTASVRRRAAKLARMVSDTVGDEGPIHTVGHSTGGLDARLVDSPSVHLGHDRRLDVEAVALGGERAALLRLEARIGVTRA